MAQNITRLDKIFLFCGFDCVFCELIGLFVVFFLLLLPAFLLSRNGITSSTYAEKYPDSNHMDIFIYKTSIMF